jgi:SAM-dependent methyltransferase
MSVLAATSPAPTAAAVTVAGPVSASAPVGAAGGVGAAVGVAAGGLVVPCPRTRENFGGPQANFGSCDSVFQRPSRMPAQGRPPYNCWMTNRRWQLLGNGPQAYEEFLVPAFFGACADLLLDAVAVQPGERVLDVACGTGIVARRAAQRVGPSGAVVGVDLNASMIEVARATDRPPGSAGIDWCVADAVALPQADCAFDVACCQQGMQYVPDRYLAVGEMVRTLVPGGRLGFASWRPIGYAPGFAILMQALLRHAGPEIAALMEAPFAGPDPAEWRRLLTGLGVGAVTIHVGILTVRFPSVDEFFRRQVASSPMAEPVAALDPQRLDALVADLDQRLTSYMDDAGLIFPMQTWLVTGRKW